MADASSLMSLLSGTNPLAPQMLDAYQGAQLQSAALDPAFGHNEGPFGAMAKMLAGFAGPGMMQRGVQATTAANQGALPDLAKLLASADPYAALAGNTAGFNPIAASRLLMGATPEQVAEARLKAAQTQLALAQAAPGPPRPSSVPGGGGMGGGATSGLGVSGIPPVAPASIAQLTGTTGRPATDTELTQILALPDAQAAAKMAEVKVKNPKLYAAWLAKLRGGANAARP